ncbi:MAG TPA: hypothetical protein P5137_17030, partial [Candidatus Brocadiia bacterium]|nr:hypothetical protein [Candidatus Brocadiia bacterium]
PALRASVRDGLIQGWTATGLVTSEKASRLRASSLRFALFCVLGAVPILGRVIRRMWGDPAWAAHARRMFTSLAYLRQWLTERRAAILIAWLRAGAVGDAHALQLANRPWTFLRLQIMWSWWLPAKWRRFITESGYARQVLTGAWTYARRFYSDAAFREAWLATEVRAGREEGMITPEEEASILNRIKDPFIQKYLKSVAVHICTLPLTQIVSVSVAIYVWLVYGKTWAQGLAYAVGVLALFQVTPVSPGSIARGGYVVWLMIRERDLRNYWVAGLISFWKYIGYLGFPLQMAQHYPTLSRFMAGRWTTNLVHAIPVFGEKGALLEHWVFDAFFNIPLTLRRWWMLLPPRARKLLGIALTAAFFAAAIALVLLLTTFRKTAAGG